MRKLLLALLFMLAATAARAQCTTLPFTLLNGTTADGGQVMADLNALNLNCLPASAGGGSGGANGRLIMFPSATWTNSPTNTTAWTVLGPPGITITCTGTQSHCLAEVFTAATQNGLSIDAFCPGERTNPGTYPFFASAVSVSTGPLAQRYFHAHGCNITFTTAVTAQAFVIDSVLDGGYFQWDGQIVGTDNTPTSSTCVVQIKPQTNAPNEGFPIVQNTRIWIGAAVGATAAGATPAGAVVCMDASTASISVSDILIGEINGCGPCTATATSAVYTDAIKMSGASTTRGIFRNRIKVGYAHNVVNAIDIGSTDNTDPANPKVYNQNQIILGNGSPNNTAGVCVIDTGSYNTGTILSCNNDGMGGSQYTNALTLTSIAHYADWSIRTAGYSQTINTVAGASTPFPIIDAGTGNNYSNNGQKIQSVQGVDRGNIANLGTQLSWIPITSISAGAGATVVSTPTNSFGQLNVGGAGAQTTVQVNFTKAPSAAHAFNRSPGCEAAAGGATPLYFNVTAVTQDSVTFTASAAIPAATVVTYRCEGVP